MPHVGVGPDRICKLCFWSPPATTVVLFWCSSCHRSCAILALLPPPKLCCAILVLLLPLLPPPKLCYSGAPPATEVVLFWCSSRHRSCAILVPLVALFWVLLLGTGNSTRNCRPDWCSMSFLWKTVGQNCALEESCAILVLLLPPKLCYSGAPPATQVVRSSCH